HRLLLEMLDGAVDCGLHVSSLRESNQRPVAWADGDLGLMAVLLDGEDHLGFKFVSEDFADFGEAGFNFLTDRGSNVVMSSRVFHVHIAPSKKFVVRAQP